MFRSLARQMPFIISAFCRAHVRRDFLGAAKKYTGYCGREFTPKELEQIRFLIKLNPEFNRARLSREVYRIFQWLKPDG